MSKLVLYMANYFECPKEKIQMVMPRKDTSSFHEYNLLHEIEMDPEVYHLGVGITLYDQSSEYPNDAVFLSFLIKELGADQYAIRLGNSSEEYQISGDNPEDFRLFYKFIFDFLREYYSS